MTKIIKGRKRYFKPLFTNAESVFIAVIGFSFLAFVLIGFLTN